MSNGCWYKESQHITCAGENGPHSNNTSSCQGERERVRIKMGRQGDGDNLGGIWEGNVIKIYRVTMKNDP